MISWAEPNKNRETSAVLPFAISSGDLVLILINKVLILA